jgi:hypothetical protein
MKKNNFFKIIKPLYIIFNLLDKSDKVKIIYAAILLIFSSLLEIFTIASVYPFLSIAFANNNEIHNFINFSNLINEIYNSNYSVLIICILYAGLLITSSLLKVYIMKILVLYIFLHLNPLGF